VGLSKRKGLLRGGEVPKKGNINLDRNIKKPEHARVGMKLIFPSKTKGHWSLRKRKNKFSNIVSGKGGKGKNERRITFEEEGSLQSWTKGGGNGNKPGVRFCEAAAKKRGHRGK